jgi:hypothetical protein
MNEENVIKRSPKRRSTIIIYTLGVYQFYINNAEKNHKEFQFQSNEIDTRKYNCITFLPKSLFYQFNRPANIYF